MNTLDLRLDLKDRNLIVLRDGQYGVKLGDWILTNKNNYNINEDFHHTLKSSISSSLDIIEIHRILYDNTGFERIKERIESGRKPINLEDSVLFVNKI